MDLGGWLTESAALEHDGHDGQDEDGAANHELDGFNWVLLNIVGNSQVLKLCHWLLVNSGWVIKVLSHLKLEKRWDALQVDKLYLLHI